MRRRDNRDHIKGFCDGGPAFWRPPRLLFVGPEARLHLLHTKPDVSAKFRRASLLDNLRAGR